MTVWTIVGNKPSEMFVNGPQLAYDEAVRVVSLDAVVRFLFDDGKPVAAAKVAAEFGALEASSEPRP